MKVIHVVFYRAAGYAEREAFGEYVPDPLSVFMERDRRQLALDFYRERMANAAKRGRPSPLSVPIHMGANAAQKVANMSALLERGIIAPVEMICRRVEANPHAGNV